MLRSPGQDGIRLLRCLEGVEAQVWHKGWLVASRWWVELPTDQEWRLFLHAGGGGLLTEADTHSPQLGDVEWVDRPWSTLRSPDRESHQNLGLERRVVSIAALALTVGIAAVGRQLWDLNQSIVQREESLASLRDSAAEVLSSRDRALKSASQAQQLATWLGEPLPIEVIGHLHDTLSKSGVQIKEMDLTGSKLRIGLQLSSQATRAAVVRDLQAGGWFKGVSETTGNSGGTGLMVLDMTIDGLRPPPQGPKAMTVAADSPSPARVSGSTK
ncbi:hypothetical protein LNV28_22295 [Paucibacter sp. DJ2R-2]|nr:hypothetical protein [Paucibacter sp. DJ2R-2]